MLILGQLYHRDKSVSKTKVRLSAINSDLLHLEQKMELIQLLQRVESPVPVSASAVPVNETVRTAIKDQDQPLVEEDNPLGVQSPEIGVEDDVQSASDISLAASEDGKEPPALVHEEQKEMDETKGTTTFKMDGDSEGSPESEELAEKEVDHHDLKEDSKSAPEPTTPLKPSLQQTALLQVNILSYRLTFTGY